MYRYFNNYLYFIAASSVLLFVALVSGSKTIKTSNKHKLVISREAQLISMLAFLFTPLYCHFPCTGTASTVALQ